MAPAREEGKMQNSCFPKLFKFREVGRQVSLVTMSCPSENCCSTSLFTTGYKRLAEGGYKLFDGGFVD
jgi:hypothetical protein